MDNTSKPPLAADVLESIEEDQHEIHKDYWQKLLAIVVPIIAISPLGGLTSMGKPPEPRRPIRLLNMLASYAAELFDCEATKYPQAADAKQWLEDLVGRIELMVMQRVADIEQGALGRLTYHATYDEMRRAIHDVLKSRIPRDIQGTSPAVLPSPQKIAANVKRKRLPITITSPLAARRLETFLKDKGIEQTAFATQVGTTDRTLRRFRETGTIRRDIFEQIANGMGLTKEQLMKG
jgi:hypothetical protein